MAMIQGKARWCKLVKPGKGFDEGTFEWSTDLEIDDATADKIRAEGAGAYVKAKDGVTFVTFKRKTKNRDGSDAKPIKLVDNKGQPWDPEKLIGNGSTLNVKYVINETSFGKKTFVKPAPLAVQVWELVEYEGKGDYEEFPVSSNEQPWS